MQVPVQREVLRGVLRSVVLALVALSATPATADWDNDGRPDLVIVGRKGASGKTEVHVLSGASNYQDFLVHAVTALGHTDDRWVFRVADWDRDGKPDLVAIDRKGASDRTEIHVLSGASNFQRFIAQIATGLGPMDACESEFGLVDWDRDGKPDLAAIVRHGASGKTEVHVLSGASSYQDFLVHAATALGHTDRATGVCWDLSLQDWDLDGTPDLVGVFHRGATGKVEIHVLSGASDYRQFIVQVATLLGDGGGPGDGWVCQVLNWDFDSLPDLAAIRRRGANDKCEVHILTGASRYQAFALQVATVFGTEATSEDYRIIMVNRPLWREAVKAGVRFIRDVAVDVSSELFVQEIVRDRNHSKSERSNDNTVDFETGKGNEINHDGGGPDVSGIALQVRRHLGCSSGSCPFAAVHAR